MILVRGGSADHTSMTAEDWKLILKGTKCITFEAGMTNTITNADVQSS